MNFFLETKTIIKINGQNHHMEDNKEGQNEIQRPHPPIEKKMKTPKMRRKELNIPELKNKLKTRHVHKIKAKDPQT